MRDSDLENSLAILDELTKLRSDTNGAIEDGDFNAAFSDVWRSIAISSCQIISAIHLNNITISDFQSMEDQRAFNKIVSKANMKLLEFKKLFGEDALRSVFLTVSRGVFGEAYIEYGVQMLAYQIMQNDPDIKKAFDGALYAASGHKSESVNRRITRLQRDADNYSKSAAVGAVVILWIVVDIISKSLHGTFSTLILNIVMFIATLGATPVLYNFVVDLLRTKNLEAARTKISEVNTGIVSDRNREFEFARDSLKRQLLSTISEIGQGKLSPQGADKMRAYAITFCARVDFSSYDRVWQACFDYYRDVATVVPYREYNVIESSGNSHVYYPDRVIGLISDIDRVCT
jgi:hypothetical protein